MHVFLVSVAQLLLGLFMICLILSCIAAICILVDEFQDKYRSSQTVTPTPRRDWSGKREMEKIEEFRRDFASD